MIAFKIDELTPCLTDALTGETFQTEVVELKRKSFLSKFKSIHPYALMINGDNMRKVMEVYDYVWSDETL